MLFTLKKFIGGLLLPLPLLLLVMGAGLVLLALSQQPVADRLLAPLEAHYPTWQPLGETVKWIVVLGGGYTWNPHWPPSANLINNSLLRVTEGIRQWRAHPGATMVFTGAAAPGNPVSSAEAASRVAQSLGVPASAIVVLDSPRDTRQETVSVAMLVGQAPLMLVTSANHLPRAMGFFTAAGLKPLPVPANQLAIESPLQPQEKILPSPLWLGHSERVWYETLGQAWQRLLGIADRPGRPSMLSPSCCQPRAPLASALVQPRDQFASRAHEQVVVQLAGVNIARRRLPDGVQPASAKKRLRHRRAAEIMKQ
ncbi:Membrane Protein Functionally coupled to the MukBEF Chromosome Partitioning Mechanism [Candidatus Sodalis pierantonius str. SOPE]|uniref:Envelope biogenesis factor ElyC n=1 Tax=Candidatus Sodalis pierantonii str. SOPE TaxID=2342 RepID=W0HKA4_9GAMM|nr:Membrane Protein Functionally coupled to the MukBEF Chromosome Partitioning Mechanism [Candidatus Sodalis pierantonius str. SOPE]